MSMENDVKMLKEQAEAGLPPEVIVRNLQKIYQDAQEKRIDDLERKVMLLESENPMDFEAVLDLIRSTCDCIGIYNTSDGVCIGGTCHITKNPYRIVIPGVTAVSKAESEAGTK